MARPRQKSSTASIEDRIVDVTDAEKYVKILAYGRNGHGKTRFAATAPNCLVIDINQRGTQSARNIKGVKVFHVKSWEDIGHIYWYLKEGQHAFESVALDTISDLQRMAMSQALGEEVEKDPNKDPQMPSKREWGKVAEMMRPTLLNFRNLDMHVIMLAQQRTIGDEEAGEAVEHVPDLSNASRGVAMGACGVMGRIYQAQYEVLNKKTNKRTARWETRMLVGPHDEYATKDRTGNLGRIIRQPTVPMIIEALNQG